jgi:ABC-2 type transport system permease protein
MEANVREIAAEAGLGVDLRGKVGELFRSRELLVNLIRKELKVRYKNSFLGFFWSMLHPLLYLLVFYVVFNVFLPGGPPFFHIYFLAGLLPWTLFATSLVQAAGSVTNNASLVKKVYFPREVLPLSAIGAGLFHFFLQFLVLVAFVVVTRYPFPGTALLLVPTALAVAILFLIGPSLLAAASNVKARDVQYFLEIGLLAWFWMTPIVYPSALVAGRLAGESLGGISLLGIYLANPMARVVLAFQRGVYGMVSPVRDGQPVPVLIDAPLGWYFQGLVYAAAAGLVLVAIGWWAFHRLDASFAEEL